MGFKCNEGQQTSRDPSEYIRLPLILWLMLTDRLTLIKQRSACKTGFYANVIIWL